MVRRFDIFPKVLFSIGPVEVTDTVIITWVVMIMITCVCYILTRRLSLKPSGYQEILEAAFEAMEKTVKDVVPVNPWMVVPILGTLWIFIGFSNLIGLLPGFKTPTADINTTFAFAVISYSMTHVFGIRTEGIRGYLAHYREPSWILLPFHLIAEVTRTIALSVRLFGNMLSGDMIAVILIGIVGLLVPVPFYLLHVIIGIIQAYIFGILTLVFIAGVIRTKP
jgi:F-type H+-transporting ATPase subunit a